MFIAGAGLLGYDARPCPDWSRSGFLIDAGNGSKINQLLSILGEL
jgi:hypothetical protein